MLIVNNIKTKFHREGVGESNYYMFTQYLYRNIKQKMSRLPWQTRKYSQSTDIIITRIFTGHCKGILQKSNNIVERLTIGSENH